MSAVKGRSLVAILFVAAFASAATSGQPSPALPNRADSLKFAAIGDNGTGDRPQFEVAQQMDKVRATFPFELVIMLGDNMYGGQQPADFIKKFQEPYARLLAAGVTFHASLGNHDRPENVSYKPFNMNGARYYTYARKNVRFFVWIRRRWMRNKWRGSTQPFKKQKRTGRSATFIILCTRTRLVMVPRSTYA